MYVFNFVQCISTIQIHVYMYSFVELCMQLCTHTQLGVSVAALRTYLYGSP